MKLLVIAMRVGEVSERRSRKHEPASKSNERGRGIREREARNVKPLVIAMRVGEVLEKGSQKHETASESNVSGRVI